MTFLEASTHYPLTAFSSPLLTISSLILLGIILRFF